jgi:hypothetical protein
MAIPCKHPREVLLAYLFLLHTMHIETRPSEADEPPTIPIDEAAKPVVKLFQDQGREEFMMRTPGHYAVPAPILSIVNAYEREKVLRFNRKTGALSLTPDGEVQAKQYLLPTELARS